MRNLMPHFIQEQDQQHLTQGHFDATAIFIDISGFTLLTEELMKYQTDGAEVLTGVLNRMFNPVVHTIYQHGGMISTFAGDAFTALFPSENDRTPQYALQAALRIQKFFEEHSAFPTPYGTFEMGVKIGVSFGDVQWGILSGVHPTSTTGVQKTYYFRGEAIKGCTAAEKYAETGDVILDQKIIDRIQTDIQTTYLRYNRQKLIQCPDNLPLKPPTLPTLTIETLSQYVQMRDFPQQAEFRNVCSVFISFDENSTDEVLNTFVGNVLNLAINFKGFFNKIDFGDKGGVILILFGAPTAFEKNVERALAFITALREVECGLLWRAGLSYGMAYTGIIGGKERCEYTAIGDAVNLAARFMIKAPYGEVWLTERIHRYSQNQYKHELLGHFRYKGIAEPVPTFKLIAKKISDEKIFAGKMIGRAIELQLLHQYLKPLFRGAFTGIITIHGEAGMGKSRLMYELKHELGDTVQWTECQPDPILQTSFNPFIQMLRRDFQQVDSDPEPVRKTKFETHFANRLRAIQATGDYADIHSELERTKSVLGALVGLSWDRSLYAQLDARGRYENTLSAVKAWLLSQSLVNPTVLLIEDGHNLDPDSWTLLDHLLHNIDHYPLAILMTLRYNDDGSRIPLKTHQPLEHTIDLKPLSKAELYELAEDGLGNPISEAFHQVLFERTKANPFFAQQFLQYLAENAWIELRENVWELTTTSMDVPDTIRAILIARLDRLSPPVREIVKTATTFGMQFEPLLLRLALEKSNPNFNPKDFYTYLTTAEQERIWTSITNQKYLFNSELMRDSIYSMQMGEKRREFHRQIVEVMEELGRQDEEHYSELAFHCEKAELTEKALFYLEKAANSAKAQYQHQQALKFYHRILNLITPNVHRRLHLRTLLQLSEIEKLTGNWEESRNRLQLILELTGDGNPPYIRAQALSRLGDLALDRSEYEESTAYYEQACALFDPYDHHHDLAEAIGRLGEIQYRKSQFDAALHRYRESLEICKKFNDNTGIVSTLLNMSNVAAHQGEYGQAMAYLEECLELSEATGDKRRMAIVLGNMGAIQGMQGNPQGAMPYLQQNLQLSEELGDKKTISRVCGNIGAVYQMQQKYELALLYYQKRLKMDEELGNRRGIAFVCNGIGAVYREQGKLDDALLYHQRALAIDTAIGNKQGVAIGMADSGRIYQLKQEYDHALHYYDKAIQLAQEIQFQWLLPAVYIHKAETLYHQKQFPRAKEIVTQGLALAQKYRPERLFAGNVISAQIDFAQGDPDFARTQIQHMRQQTSDPEQIRLLDALLEEMQ